MESNSSIFDENAEFYGRIKPSWHDYYLLEFIKCHRNTRGSLLDVGGGSGIFSTLVKNMDPSIDVTIVDPSQILLNKVPDIGIKKTRGSLPDNLNLEPDLVFGYIHLREVIHHIVGHTEKDSKDLAVKSLMILRNHLDDNGYIMIHELFYEGYIIPSISRSIIFHLLNFQNNIGIKVPSREFLNGLQVCFYARNEFNLLLASCGYRLVDQKIDFWESHWKKRALMIKKWGTMILIAKKF
jgi:hypothetical protein